MQVKTYLILTGMLAVAYTGYTYLNKAKHSLIPKDLTKRISQQIKHQMMIVCITYAKAMNKIRSQNAQKFKQKSSQLLAQFRNQLSQVYLSKENLILRKYTVSRETYGKSLEKFKNDKTIGKNITQIFQMMERALQAKLPDFTVPKQVNEKFNNQKLAEIYKQMVTLIGKKVTIKLQEQCRKNSKFNPASDDDFRNAIRQLSIYDIKVKFLQTQGFKQEWGCPNQVFFKVLQSQKAKNQEYQKKIVAYEKTYQKVIQIVSNDPKSLDEVKIDNMFANALFQPSASKPVINPVSAPKPIVQVPAPVPVAKKPQPKKQQLQQEDLQKMMMNQLLNRSQQEPQSQEKVQKPSIQQVNIEEKVQQQIIHPQKVGLTEGQIQAQGQQQGVNTKMQQAKQQVQVAENDQGKLVEKQQQIVDAIVNYSQAQQENNNVESQQTQQKKQQQIVDTIVNQSQAQQENNNVESQQTQQVNEQAQIVQDQKTEKQQPETYEQIQQNNQQRTIQETQQQ